MKQQRRRPRSRQRREIVRLTIDFPVGQHTYIKMLAAKEGVSLRQFVIDHLPDLKEGEGKRAEIDNDEFDKSLQKLLIEKAGLLKRLSKK